MLLLCAPSSPPAVQQTPAMPYAPPAEKQDASVMAKPSILNTSIPLLVDSLLNRVQMVASNLDPSPISNYLIPKSCIPFMAHVLYLFLYSYNLSLIPLSFPLVLYYLVISLIPLAFSLFLYHSLYSIVISIIHFVNFLYSFTISFNPLPFPLFLYHFLCKILYSFTISFIPFPMIPHLKLCHSI